MINPFRQKTLKDLLYKRVKVFGVIFVIKKIDMADYLEGAKVLVKTYDTYQTKPEAQVTHEVPFAKVKAHMIDVLMAGVVEPELSRKGPEEGKTFVEHLFNEEELVIGLYQEILQFTFGKKKVLGALPNPASWKSTR